MTTTHRTQVAIIGSGPSGLLLAKLLSDVGVDNILIDRVSHDYILSRVRAGVLERGSVAMLEQAGCATRMNREGLPHDGFKIAYDDQICRIDLTGHTGQGVMVYGQTEVTKDLMDARASAGGLGFYGASEVQPQGFDGDHPFVTFTLDGEAHRIECDFIAGCDGYHGPSRKAVPASAITEFETTFPFGWLGVLAEVPPVSHELIYAHHARGFALCSMRSETRSRYYLQCSLRDKAEDWSDNQFWDELRLRLPADVAEGLVTGASFEKSIAPLRSFVAEPMRFGRMFLAGDAAHIVPPTGAKGLNLAFSDVHYLFEGLRAQFSDNDVGLLDAYSERALKRVWKSVGFSCRMTNLLHRFDDRDPFNHKLQQAELAYLASSNAASKTMAENYIGLPF